MNAMAAAGMRYLMTWFQNTETKENKRLKKIETRLIVSKYANKSTTFLNSIIHRSRGEHDL